MVDNLQPTKYGSFLDYPFEIRAMVYEDFFAADFCEIDHGKEDFGQPPPREGGPRLLIEYNDQIENSEADNLRRMTAYDKVSLLVANKAVFEEALSCFHKLHVFQLPQFDTERTILSHPERLPYCIRQVLQAIAKVRLVRQPGEDDNQFIVAHHVQFLADACPNLTSLTVGVTVEDEPSEPYPLEQLWPRLNYLQLNVTYWCAEEVRPYLDLIAPGLKWSWYKMDTLFDGPYGPPTLNRVFYLDRAHLEKGFTEIEDDTLPGSKDGDSMDSDDRYDEDVRQILMWSRESTETDTD